MKSNFKKGEISLPWPGLGTIVGQEELEAVTDVIKESIEKRKELKGGKLVERFEKEFAQYVDAKYAIAVSSCGVALLISGKILGLKEGNEVIVPPNTHVSTATSLMEIGAKPIFVDIKKNTFNIDPEKIEEKISSRTKAIYPVHYAGQPCDMNRILEIAKKHSLYVVEDAAHTPGAEYKGKRVGSIGDITCFSFQTQKNMTTLGEGGMITTNNKDFAEKAKILRSFGVKKYTNQENYWQPWHYDVVAISNNFRMTEVQGAFGLVQLKKLDRITERRREIAYYLTKNLKKIKGIIPPYENPDIKHVYHIYNVLFKEKEVGFSKDKFIEKLYHDYKIKPIIHYLPVYLFTVFQERGYKKGECPVAEEVFKESLGLPLYPGYSQREIDYLLFAVKEVLGNN